MERKTKWTKEKCHEAALKYKTKKDFAKYSGAEHSIAYKKGWISDICSHMVELAKPAGYWNKKENIIKLLEEIKPKNFKDLGAKYYAAQRSIRINGWSDEFFPNRRKYNYWGNVTKEEVRIKASEYKHMYEFQQKCSPAYKLAKTNGWLDEFFTARRVLTYDICKEVIAKYNSYSELYQNDVTVLYKVQSKGWDELISHWEKPYSSKNLKWTYERCKEEVSKFKYLSELQGTSVVNVIRTNGWYDELTAHLVRQAHPVYTKDEVLVDALKYKTRTEFQINSPGQYGAANRLNIMQEATKHMGKALNKKQYTKEEILESALKYGNQRDWLIAEPSIYRCAVGYYKPKTSEEDKAFFKQCISHMEYIFKPNGYWTYERCKEVALKFKTAKEFRENNEYNSVYNIIYKNGWLDLMDHIQYAQKPKGYWTYERCKEAALKYKTRSEFSKCEGDCTAYHIINKNGWTELLKHMKRRMTLKQRHIYVYEFPLSKLAYIGLTYNLERRHAQHMQIESKKIKSSVFDHIQKTGEEYIFKVLTRRPVNEDNAPNIEESYIKKYKDNGWTLLNKAKSGSLGSRYIWTYDRVESIAQTCKTRWEFNNKVPSHARSGRGILTKDQIRDMTKHLFNEITTWTYELCKEAASEFDCVGKFQKKYAGAYKFAIRTNIIKELFPYTNNELKARQYDDYDKFMEIALRYNSISEFRIENRGLSNFAFKKGWYSEIKKIYAERNKKVKPLKIKPTNYSIKLKREYTKDDVINSSLKYQHLTEWFRNDKQLYRLAKKMNIFKEVTSHMTPKLPVSKYNFEIIKTLCIGLKNRSELQTKMSGAFKVAKNNNWLDILFPIKGRN